MKSNSLSGITALLSMMILQTLASCAVNRIIYSEHMEIDGVLARVVVLSTRELNELVISMQNPGEPIKERVFLINWMPEYVEIDDYNGDSRMDFKIVSIGDVVHYFFSTELGFVDI